MALPNINNGNPLCHNDDLSRHGMVILLEVVNDAAPCQVLGSPLYLESDSSSHGRPINFSRKGEIQRPPNKTKTLKRVA